MEDRENNNEIVPELAITLPKNKDIGKPRVSWSSIESKLPIDILLVTAIDYEFRSCYFYLKNRQRSHCDGLGMVDFGEFGDGQVKVALIRCSGKGANEVRSPQIVVKNAADILRPKAAICVGCCGLVNPKKAKLGDVVISTKLGMYSNVKVTSDGKQWRGIKTNVSRNMGYLIPTANQGWDAPLMEPESFEVKVHVDAVMLSGPELVNDLGRRDELLKLFPDAIALEMEGEGLFAAASDLGLEWVVVKGISDRADGSKTKTGNWQPFACAMAASVVYNMFEYPDVIQNWSHYQARVPGGTSTSVTPAASNSPTPSNPVQQILESIAGTTKGRRIHNGRTIEYSVSGRFHSPKEPWVFDATATDIATGETVEKNHFKTADLAINEAIKELLTQRMEQVLLD